MIQPLRALAGAFAYYTILPMGRAAGQGPPDAAALAFLPAAGAVTGALAGLAGWGAALWLHGPWGFVVAWAACIAFTGAIHVDGFLDACDGLLVTATAARRREILKDPRHGTFAVAGMAVLSAVWLAALSQIPPAHYPLVLAFAGATARLAVIPNAWIFPYARAGTMAHSFAARPPIVAAAMSAIVVAALGWYVAPWTLALVPAAIVVALACAAWAGRRLGGQISGDVYGATIVILEVLVLGAIGAIAL